MGVSLFTPELTTVLTTTMTTVALPDTSTYTTIETVSCLVTPSARAYGSEGWEFESLRAHYSSVAVPVSEGGTVGILTTVGSASRLVLIAARGNHPHRALTQFRRVSPRGSA